MPLSAADGPPGPRAATSRASCAPFQRGYEALGALSTSGQRPNLLGMSEETIDTVYLIGTGAESNPWEAVLKAISGLEMRGLGDPTQVTKAEGAVTYFRALVHGRREALRMASMPGMKRQDKAVFDKAYRDLTKAHVALKKEIAENLRAARAGGSMKLRDGFLSYVTARPGTRALLTTNWDLLLEGALKTSGFDPNKVRHLHGHIDEPELMLLPGEIIDEPYRSAAHAKKMQWSIKPMWKVFEAAQSLVIYGHSLSGVEAELGTALWLGFSEHPGRPEIRIVNRSKKDARIVADRLRPLLPAGPKPWKIACEKGQL